VAGVNGSLRETAQQTDLTALGFCPSLSPRGINITSVLEPYNNFDFRETLTQKGTRSMDLQISFASATWLRIAQYVPWIYLHSGEE
jgi:hypothetical protein